MSFRDDVGLGNTFLKGYFAAGRYPAILATQDIAWGMFNIVGGKCCIVGGKLRIEGGKFCIVWGIIKVVGEKYRIVWGIINIESGTFKVGAMR
ncbi:MAG: hypothetical protein GY950_20825 [bacterium]|nr:hypothetical protein [bacterium]